MPLSELAQITEEDGPVVVFREDHQRYAPVKFSVRGRDRRPRSQRAEPRHQFDQASVRHPPGLGGEIDQLRETTRRLMVVVPLTLLIIGFLIYLTVKTLPRTPVIVLLGIPVAASGGVLALAVTGSPLSISAAMGFISLLGIAVQDALIVVNYAQRLWREGQPLGDCGARLAAERGLRPVLMTAGRRHAGLLPAALSTGIGSETQKPLAIVVIGGALSLAILPRLLHPPLLVLSRSRRWRGSRPAS